MSYGREEDRYYRRELAELIDGVRALSGHAESLRDELREDDGMKTLASRDCLVMARACLAGAVRDLDRALGRLPAPTICAPTREVR